jgi:hypothetical protein
MRPVAVLGLAGLLSASVVLGGYVQNQALIGFGLYTYEPMCGETCLRSFQGYMLNCTEMSDGSGMMGHMMMTTPDCWAKDEAYLTSIAYCMSVKCPEQDVPVWKMEIFWAEQVTGHPDLPPKWSYGEALHRANPSPPTYQMTNNDTMLKFTSLVNPDVYLAQWNVLSAVYRETILENLWR